MLDATKILPAFSVVLAVGAGITAFINMRRHHSNAIQGIQRWEECFAQIETMPTKEARAKAEFLLADPTLFQKTLIDHATLARMQPLVPPALFDIGQAFKHSGSRQHTLICAALRNACHQ